MTPDELKELVAHIRALSSEHQTVEVKAAHDGTPRRLYDTLSAFSNQDDGGTIIFGVDEDHGFEIVGVHDVGLLQDQVAEQCDQMDPKIRPLFTICQFGEKYVVSAEIPAIDLSDRPCFYAGKGRVRGSYKRVGRFDEPMTDYEVYSYEAYRRHFQDDVRILDRSNESQIDPSALNRYLLKIKADKPHLAALADDQILTIMNLVNDRQLTLAGAFLLGFYPQSLVPQLCITAVRIPGTEIGEIGSEGERFIDNARIEGTIPTMLDDAMAFIRRNCRQSTSVNDRGEHSDSYEYPIIAVREIILNALIHRDYSALTEGIPITVRLFDDRLEVSNPGGLYGRINPAELGHVKPDTRNPVIASTMEILDLTENRYSGIPTIRREMEKAHLPAPVFRSTLSDFTVILYNRRVSESPDRELGEGIASAESDKGFAGNGNGHVHEQRIRNRHDKGDAYMSVLEFCATPRTRQEIAQHLGLQTIPYVSREIINPLIDRGDLVLTIPDKPQSRHQRFVTAKSD